MIFEKSMKPLLSVHILPQVETGDKKRGESHMIMRIKELRLERGLDQVSLATQMGVNQSVISEWEREAYLPRARQLPQLDRVLGCSIDELFAPDTEAAAAS